MANNPANDPYAEFGTAVTPVPAQATTQATAQAAPNSPNSQQPQADPYAEFGAAVKPETNNTTGDPDISPLLKESAEPEPPKGFINTALSDVGKFASGAIDTVGKTVGYLGQQVGIGQPSMNANQQKELEQAQDAHKSEVYKKFRDDFHNQHYADALLGLVNLFDPKYDDPNDPIAQMAQAQWDSSKMAKARMVEAMKQDDYKGVVQHAAGMLPIASQVDDAMERYSKDPSRENLAHIVTAAIPAFIPSLYRGAKAISHTSAAAQTAAALKQIIPPGIQDFGETVARKFGGASHVYDPTTGKVVPTEEIGNAVTPRQDIGEAVQTAADTVQTKLGQEVGAAKARAAAVPLLGGTSVEFMQDMINIADEVDKHVINSKALGPGDMAKVKNLVDEVSGKSLTQKDFEGYAKRIDSEISKTEGPGGDKQVGRMYTRVKEALKKEYYAQIALSDPAVAKALQDANHAYAGITSRLERGPARRAFGADSPEAISKQVGTGSITETKADAIMQTLKEADQITPRSGPGYVDDFRRSVLYQQVMKHAAKVKGVVVRMDSAKMLEELNKNPTYRHIYGDEYNKIYESVKADASRAFNRKVVVGAGTAMSLAVLGSYAKNHIIRMLGGLVAHGVE